MAERMRLLSSRKLDEVEALLDRTKAMKGWLEVAHECGSTPEECALIPQPGDDEFALSLIRVRGRDCRRPA